jgi:ubiquinone/menaquinone biosynthesis C-methylase UbiE
MATISAQTLTANASRDQQSREAFVAQMTRTLDAEIRPRFRRLYDQAPLVGSQQNPRSIAEHMLKLNCVRLWYALRSENQRLKFATVRDTVEADEAHLRGVVETLRKVGSLTLDPDLPVPRYLAALDTHLMAGSYYSEKHDRDMTAGAVYDRAIGIHNMGSHGGLNDDAGRSIVAWLEAQFPGLKPRRILDMGCTVGHFTLPFKAAFPDAEVHAIDVAAPCLRYGHARARALGVEVHFHQMNAESTSFPDQHFDLVVSRILLHETSLPAVKNIFAECFRLLAPGGVMLHSDAPQFDELDAYTASLRHWDTHYNNEPFMERFYQLPLETLYQQAGFPTHSTFRSFVPGLFFKSHPRPAAASRNPGGRYFVSGARRRPG